MIDFMDKHSDILIRIPKETFDYYVYMSDQLDISFDELVSICLNFTMLVLKENSIL